MRRALLILLLGLGCASVPGVNSRTEHDAKRLQAKPGMARLYVLREKGLYGSGLTATVNVGANLGYLANGTFLVFDVEPGDVVVSWRTDAGPGAIGLATPDVATLRVLRGEVVFLSVVCCNASPTHWRRLEPGAGESLVREFTMAWSSNLGPGARR